MLSTIERKILNRLAKSSDYISSKDLAFALNTSEKTILKYLNQLKNILPENGATLEVKHGYGSYLAITDQHTFNAFLGEKDEADDIPITKEGRKAYVLSRLINTDEYINIYDLADELYVSPSLLRLTIKGLADTLETYDLNLDHSKNHGYRITGSEMNLRHCLVKECKDAENFDNYMLFNELKYDLVTQVSSIIARNFEKYHIAVSEDAIDSLTLHVLISINRHETANAIEVDESIVRKLQSSPEYFVMRQINKEMAASLNVSLPDIELAYLTLHLNGKQRLIAHEHIQVQISDNALIFYNQLLRNIYQKANVSFFEDDELRVSLLNHIVPFLNRLQNDLQITKSSLAGIKNQFPYAYDLAVIGLSFLNDDYEITSAEIGYFALHLALSMEKNKGLQQSCNIAVIANELSGLWNMMSYKLNRSFPNAISTIKFYSISEARTLSEEVLSSYALVLNTTSERITFPNAAVLNISTFITDREIEEIRNALRNAPGMNSPHVFNEKLYINISGNCTREDMIRHLISSCRKLYDIPAEYYESVMERERLESTEYGNRMAIPHPMTVMPDHSFVAVARLEKPLRWDSQKIQLVFLVNLPDHSQVEWFMDKITKLLGDDELCKALLETDSYQQFTDQFISL